MKKVKKKDKKYSRGEKRIKLKRNTKGKYTKENDIRRKKINEKRGKIAREEKREERENRRGKWDDKGNKIKRNDNKE